ncbi:MAP3K12-binding inhibitory protein 1-like isoform X2 [Dendronephthya gigantea]|uniref:MAP3K12-binding inhibitory protein 1-like isoform X2 n=1 Tax=Dendronephthya gigantea TaxID=151771 RepID=UPI00106C7699|nr:MAP3K12-binding inhibitory protein 1-like isoform X2 [Dendronephthya gigantea]
MSPQYHPSFNMAEVFHVFEIYLKKMAGACFDFRVNYDELSSFIGNSLGEAEFWQIVRQFVESLQAMLNERTKVNFEQEVIPGDISGDIKSVIKSENHSPIVDPSLVQITANKAEMDRRIAAFLRKKQLDVDIHNQREFCNLLHTENEYSCARVDAVFLPRVGQKSHITVTDADRESKIMESDNITVDTMLYSLPVKRQRTADDDEEEELPSGVEERLDNIESHLRLSVKSVEYNVYQRIKKLEEKILHLEGLSPEYFNYQNGSGYPPSRRLRPQKQTGNTDLLPSSGSSSDLDERMLKLKEKLLSEKLTGKRS